MAELNIDTEAAACRKACNDLKVGDVVQHIHHEKWLEILTEPIENRIAFILDNKPIIEQAERLRRMRPFDWKKAYADRQKAYADWQKADASQEMIKLHAEVCGCPWDATHDIFGNSR